MHVGHETTRIAAAVGTAGRLVGLLERVNVSLGSVRPFFVIAFIDGVYFPTRRHLDAGMRQLILADVGIERKPVDALAGRKDEHRARPEQKIAGRQLIGAFPEQIVVSRRLILMLVLDDRKDRSQRHIDVGVRRAVQWIKEHHVGCGSARRVDKDRLFHFFRGQGAGHAVPLQDLNKRIISNLIQLFDGFTLGRSSRR